MYWFPHRLYTRNPHFIKLYYTSLKHQKPLFWRGNNINNNIKPLSPEAINMCVFFMKMLCMIQARRHCNVERDNAFLSLSQQWFKTAISNKLTRKEAPVNSAGLIFEHTYRELGCKILWASPLWNFNSFIET